MKKTKLTEALVLFMFIFVLFINSFAQENATSDFCGTNELDFGKLHIPTSTMVDGQYLRALFIFVTFPDDNLDGDNNCIWPNPYLHPEGTRPMNPHTVNHNIVSPSEESGLLPPLIRYEKYTISDYFCQMSGGQLDFIGDEVFFRLPNPSTYYQNTLHWRRSQLNQYILQYVNDNLNINFANYDNWHKEGSNWVWGKDGEAEMIVIQLRQLPGDYDFYYWNQAGVGGEAHLFGQSDISVSFDKTTITNDDGITATQGLYRTSHLELVLEHEISHHIFAYEFNHIGFNPSHVSIGMMTEYHSHSTFCMTPMERSMNWQLNWLIPNSVEPTQSLYSFSLRDEFEYGDAVKVSIPKANESQPQEYLWITNHQKKSRYDGISRGSNDCYQFNQSEIEPFCSVGKGLYIFHESDRYCDNNINGYNSEPLIQNWRHYAFDIKSAWGRWNWDLDTHVIDQYLGAFDIQKIVTRNIITGVNKFNKRFLRAWPNYSAQLLSRDLCWNPPNYKISADFHGDGKEAYNVDYNNIMSPYSNSSSNNYHNPSFNTGLTIYLIWQDPESGTMYIQVCYDDNYAQTHYPPAKPQNLKVTPSFVIQGVSYYPRLTWEQNLEPNFSNNGTYKIYRGLSSNCNIEPQLNNYGYVATVGGNITEFIDYSMLLYNGSSGNDNCPTIQQNVSYKITANLNNLESVKSERSLIQGYFINCISETSNDKIYSINQIPNSFELKQNYPNPFNPVTNIRYDLPKDVFVSIKIYDITGREIKSLVNEIKTIGSHVATFNGSEFTSGIYFYRIQAGDFVLTKRMILLK